VLILTVVFTMLFGEVCALFSIIVPILKGNSSASETNVTFPSGVVFNGGWIISLDAGTMWTSALGLGIFLDFGGW
jgi:hypothetical protein